MDNIGDLRLFDSFDRTYRGRSNHDSSTYDFLNRSAWRGAAYVRERVEEWAKGFPVDKDFHTRFTSKNNKAHGSAFFELVMFEWFRRQRFDVAFQDTIEGQGNRKPDLSVKKHGSTIMVAECRLSPMPGIMEGIEKLKGRIIDVLESIPSPSYFVNINFEACSTRTISNRNIRTFIQNLLDEGLDDNDGNLFSRKEWQLLQDGWQITFSLIPKSSPEQRSLGMISNGAAQIIDSEKPLRSSLNSKRASAYGKQKVPFIICVNSADFHLDEIDMVNTLFGRSGTIKIDYKERQSSDNGFFLNSGRPQNTTVAAVIIIKGLVPWNLHVVKATLWQNPWAVCPLAADMLDIEHVNYIADDHGYYHQKRTGGISIGEVLEIDPTYIDDPLQ